MRRGQQSNPWSAAFRSKALAPFLSYGKHISRLGTVPWFQNVRLDTFEETEQILDAQAVGLALASVVVTFSTWLVYFSKVPSGNVPVRPVGSVLLQVLAIGLGILATVWDVNVTGSVHVAVILPAAVALMMASFFLWLLTQRRTPIGDLKVEVGDQLLAFEALTSDGTAFRSGELLGKRTLLKFFRGGW